MKDSSATLTKARTKMLLALVVSMTLFLNAAHASSAVTLASPNPQVTGEFGRSVAVSGTTVVVGAPFESGGVVIGKGHAYIIDTTTDPLTFTLTSPGAMNRGFFGTSVAVSGTTVVVGAPGETSGTTAKAGNAYVFDATTGALVSPLITPHPVTDGRFGFSVAVSGTTVVVGAPAETSGTTANAGNAYVFDATTGALVSPLITPHAVTNGLFGFSVAVSGTTVVVGAPGEDSATTAGSGNAYTFDATTGALISTLASPGAVTGGFFGISVAISDTTVVVGASDETSGTTVDAGNAYVFDTTTSTIVPLTTPNPVNGGNFGISVAVSGTTVAVGASDETSGTTVQGGNAYLFDATTGTRIATLASPYVQNPGFFGISVAISDDPTVVVGAYAETESGQNLAGHAFIF